MFFFGKNLQPKHKVALCLVILGILVNYWVCICWAFNKMPFGTYPMIEFLTDEDFKVYLTQIVLSFGIFVKMLVLCIFRKF